MRQVRQEPNNMQYRMLLQRMEGGGGWYQQQQDPFGGMPTAGGDMCDACLQNSGLCHVLAGRNFLLLIKMPVLSGDSQRQRALNCL